MGRKNANCVQKNSTFIPATADFRVHSKFKDAYNVKIYNLKSVKYGRQINKSIKEMQKDQEINAGHVGKHVEPMTKGHVTQNMAKRLL